MIIASIDIGSTWTKGALFEFSDNAVHLVKQSKHKTTLVDLFVGFRSVFKSLTSDSRYSKLRHSIEILYSSSAKGGLSIAAVGLVPNLTLETAKLAAYSSGARISCCYSYRITQSDLIEIERLKPDIVLLTGGTDGGDTEYVISNAEILAMSNLCCPIIYAGNRVAVDSIKTILSKKDIYVLNNLMPEVGVSSLEEVREKIRSIFIDKIVFGKGLDSISRFSNCQPVPTPFAVHELVGHIAGYSDEWSKFMLMDLGGATTDIYSHVSEECEMGVVYRGLIEPDNKRTVEGDLGMRVSALNVVEMLESSEKLNTAINQNIKVEHVRAYVDSIEASPEHISVISEDMICDESIAQFCLTNAAARHAGRMKTVHTVDGKVHVQLGRNLRNVRKVVGSGGYLANQKKHHLNEIFGAMNIDHKGDEILVPTHIEYYRDEKYLIPLYANLALCFPKATTEAVVKYLNSVNQHTSSVSDVEKGYGITE